jgi:hypothetical protein
MEMPSQPLLIESKFPLTRVSFKSSVRPERDPARLASVPGADPCGAGGDPSPAGWHDDAELTENLRLVNIQTKFT